MVNLISVDNVTDHIYQHSGISSVLTGSFASPGVSPQGIAVDNNGNLISSDNLTDHIYTHLSISSILTGSFASPSTTSQG
jgi:hypothetical protein